MDKTTIYIPRDIHLAVRAIARRTGRSQAVVIREALAAYVAQDDQHDRSWPTTIGMVEDGTVSGAESEDWLKEHWKRDW